MKERTRKLAPRENIVAPGFIDVTNHSDTFWRVFLNPDLESLIYQGITTIVGGNCGSSLAPLVSHDIIKSIQKWADIRSVNLNWLKMGEFLGEVENRKLSVNFATLVGHGTLRRGLIGDEIRDFTPSELRAMKEMLKEAMKEGALGLSTGLSLYSCQARAGKRNCGIGGSGQEIRWRLCHSHPGRSGRFAGFGGGSH